MLRLLLLVFGLVTAGVVGVSIVGFSWLHKIQKRKRDQSLVTLRAYHRRLQYVVSELLARVDDLDQQSKFLDRPASADWSQCVAILCEDLVRLGDSVRLIEELLAAKDVQRSRMAVLVSCKSASKASRNLIELRRKFIGANR